jgi:hypothetical protein
MVSDAKSRSSCKVAGSITWEVVAFAHWVRRAKAADVEKIHRLHTSINGLLWDNCNSRSAVCSPSFACCKVPWLPPRLGPPFLRLPLRNSYRPTRSRRTDWRMPVRYGKSCRHHFRNIASVQSFRQNALFSCHWQRRHRLPMRWTRQRSPPNGSPIQDQKARQGAVLALANNRECHRRNLARSPCGIGLRPKCYTKSTAKEI